MTPNDQIKFFAVWKDSSGVVARLVFHLVGNKSLDSNRTCNGDSDN